MTVAPGLEGAASRRRQAGRRQLGYLLRYSAVSVGVVVAEQALLFICFGIVAWSTTTSNLVAFAALTGPAFYLNRRWVWGGGGGRSRLLAQVVPFWALGLLGLALSVWATAVVAAWTEGIDDRQLRALFVNVASLTAYGVVWVVKFVVLTTLVFNRPPPEQAAGGQTAPDQPAFVPIAQTDRPAGRS